MDDIQRRISLHSILGKSPIKESGGKAYDSSDSTQKCPSSAFRPSGADEWVAEKYKGVTAAKVDGEPDDLSALLHRL